MYTTEWTAYPISKEDNNIEVLVTGSGKIIAYEIFRINCKNKSDKDVINAYAGEDYMSIEEYMQEFEEHRGQMVKNLFKKFCR